MEAVVMHHIIITAFQVATQTCEDDIFQVAVARWVGVVSLQDTGGCGAVPIRYREFKLRYMAH